jgi:hypothetical protein
MRSKNMKNKSIMLRLTLLSQAVLHLIKETCLLPRSIAAALQNRRQQMDRHAAEAERLDRIRNPADYLGK